MMEEEFRLYLKRMGKKAHVVDQLLGHVDEFRAYLAELGRNLDEADVALLHAYVDALSDQDRVRKVVRGLILYFRWTHKDALASAAAEIREAEIARSRRSFPLKDFRGIAPGVLSGLESVGVVNVAQMLEKGRTPAGRASLARETGLDEGHVLELVKLSDLARIRGIKGTRARLYYDAGIDSIEKLADMDPEEMRHMLEDFVRRTQFDGIAPLPKEALSAVRKARGLPKIIEY